MLQYINYFLKRYFQKGQGIVEYALILAFVVAVAAVLADANGLREAITQIFTDTEEAVRAGHTE